MTDLPQLQRDLVAAAERQAAGHRTGRATVRRLRPARLVPRVLGVAALIAVAVVMLAPREEASREFTSGGTSLERLARLVPAFARPARAGDRPRWPGAEQGTWRRIGRRDGRRGWLGLTRSGGRAREELCLVVDFLPWAQEAVDCRPAAGALDGTRVLGAVTHGDGPRITFAMAAVPAAADLVVFTRERGSPVAAVPTGSGLVAYGDPVGLTGVQFRRAGGGMTNEAFEFRQRGVPGGLVDGYAVWRRRAAPGDRRPTRAAPPGRLSTWRRVWTDRPDLQHWIRWTGSELCTHVRHRGKDLGGRCAAQDEAYGGAVTEVPSAGVRVLALPDRVVTIDVVRADGSGDRHPVEENGAVVPARAGDRELRLLDRDGAVLQVRRL